MPPKKPQQPSKKVEQKKKERIIEDKTFGLKNKKGKRQQQLIKQVTNQVKYGGQSIQKRESAEYQAKQRKTEDQKEKTEINLLFRPVQTQKVSSGADPKSVLCIFYKQGQCTKGDKCKFSHDLSLEQKSEKKSVYIDSRDLEEDTIDKWDEEKLKEVVEKKHGEKSKPKTDIVCKHFLHAIEKGIYGWFWECPSGGDKCIYRHALPPGFVFKKGTKEEEQEEVISMEELVEKEREQLAASGKQLTKVTLETFLAWKERKLKEKREKAEMEMAKRKEAFSAGRTHGISGREMFEFNPELVEEDDLEATDDVIYKREEDEEESQQEEKGVDVTGMVAVSLPMNPLRESLEEGRRDRELKEEGRGTIGGAVGGTIGVAGGGAVGGTIGGAVGGAVGGIDHKHLLKEAMGREEERTDEEQLAVVVDESLFDIEILEDLDLNEDEACDVMD